MANNQSDKYKVVWLDNISASVEENNAVNKSIEHPHAVVFSGLNNNEDITTEQNTSYWSNWYDDYNIYKGGVRYTKFVDTADNKKQISEYEVGLSFDYPSGLVSINSEIGADGYYWYIGADNQHNVQTVTDNDITTDIMTAGWHKIHVDENKPINNIYYNILADYRSTNQMEFTEPVRYIIVLPAFLVNAGYVPMHDISDAELGNDEGSFKKEYITINGHAYVQYIGYAEQDQYAGVIAKRK